ncbi:MAG: hypothetical protein ACSHX7_04985 [Luteolibacter sp.]
MASKKASFSIASLIAIIAAVLSFKVGVFLGLILAAIAFICGVVGMAMAMGKETRGGLLSSIAVGLSFIGVVVAVIKAIIWAFSLGG